METQGSHPCSPVERVSSDTFSPFEHKAELTKILTYHVVSGKVMAAQAMKLNSAKTVNGKELTIKTEGGKVMINDATVTKADIHASNGVIHVIDTVLLP